jgi:hypothetical protein
MDVNFLLKNICKVKSGATESSGEACCVNLFPEFDDVNQEISRSLHGRPVNRL